MFLDNITHNPPDILPRSHLLGNNLHMQPGNSVADKRLLDRYQQHRQMLDIRPHKRHADNFPDMAPGILQLYTHPDTNAIGMPIAGSRLQCMPPSGSFLGTILLGSLFHRELLAGIRQSGSYLGKLLLHIPLPGMY